MMAGVLLFLIATAAQLALLWLAMAHRGGLARNGRRLQSLRQRHPVTAPNRQEAAGRRASAGGPAKNGASKAGQNTAPTRPALAFAPMAAFHTARLHRTGLGWSLRRYLQISAALGLGLAGLVLLKTGSVSAALLLGGIAGGWLPYAVVGNLITRRRRAFITKLPEAIDLLVVGLRSGLPVSETLGIVTNEVPGPVGQEFKLVTERMRIGRSMEDAFVDSAERLGLPEFNFFCITLAIHRETGGNLTETLVNLADVLRRRAQMTLKIRALSSESRTSAIILGALPFIVFGIIWASDAAYLTGFFTDRRLIITGLGGLVWMAIGAGVMARMVSFDI